MLDRVMLAYMALNCRNNAFTRLTMSVIVLFDLQRELIMRLANADCAHACHGSLQSVHACMHAM